MMTVFTLDKTRFLFAKTYRFAIISVSNCALKVPFFLRRDPSCYLGEGVAVIYSLHTTGARLTRCVSEWLSLGSWQLLPPLLKRQSTLWFYFFPPRPKGEVITCPETFFLCAFELLILSFVTRRVFARWNFEKPNYTALYMLFLD